MSTSETASYHHGGLRAALLRSALDLLEEGDAETLSLRAVARRAGVSAMAPYRHYPDKESLLASAAKFGFDDLRAALLKADSTAPSESALLAQGVAYVRYAVEHPNLFRLMFGPPRRGEHADLRASNETAFSVLVRRVAEETDAAELQSRVLGYWSLVHGLAMLILDGQTPVAGLRSAEPENIERIIASMLGPIA